MRTNEKNVVQKLQSEVDYKMTSVETRIQDAVLTEIESLVIPTVELAMKSAGRSVDGNVLEFDQRGFLGNIESPANDRFKQNKLAYRLK